MAALKGLTVAVIGAGVFGSVTGMGLAKLGATVTLYDPARLGDNASGVAAGMLAPALEAGLDDGPDGWFDLLRQGRDLWLPLLRSLDAPETLLDRTGTLFLGDGGTCEDLIARLDAIGARAELISPERAAELSPGLSPAALSEVVLTPEDWRLDPCTVLRALQGGFEATGGRMSPAAVAVGPKGQLLAGGVPLLADAVVIAGGMDSHALAEVAPEAALLSPIKGQILHFTGGPLTGPVVRTSRGYIAPQAQGAIVGATMEAGLRDRSTDAAALARLRTDASALFPSLARAPARGLAGVRAATSDGLPLVGRTQGAAHVLLCVGARRNGWLLAPLVAEIIAGALLGEEIGAAGAAFSPSRFPSL